MFLPFFGVGKYSDPDSSVTCWTVSETSCYSTTAVILDDLLPSPRPRAACPATLRAIFCNRFSCFIFSLGISVALGYNQHSCG